jgi:DNA-binding transcriptional MerR regulator
VRRRRRPRRRRLDVNRTQLSRADEGGTSRRVVKSASAFRTTGEVADELDLPTHVLRFWESKFPQVKPLKRGGGRRYYRPEDVDLLRRIRRCLYQHGYTIRGVQKLLRDGALRADEPPPPFTAESPPPLFTVAIAPPADPLETAASLTAMRQPLRETLEEVRRELLEIRALVDGLGVTEEA